MTTAEKKDSKVPLQMILGMKLGMLLRVLARNGYQVDKQCRGRLSYLVLVGMANSALAAVETLLNGRKMIDAKLDGPPLFVIGHWRSGTTHLHNLLSLDENFLSPTVYQAMFPHHCQWTGRGKYVISWLVPKTRPMDNVDFSGEVPHEDEFALAALSGVSPYLRVLFPVTGDKGYSELDLAKVPPGARDEWKRWTKYFFTKLNRMGDGRPLLKSPPHLGRVGPLLELFPDAQFIHIVRDPYAVYVSTRNLWRKMFFHSHLQMPDPELVEDTIFTWYSELFSLFERDRHLVPAGALHEVKYEDLEQKPEESLENIYRELSLPGIERVLPRVRGYLEAKKDYQKNVFQLDASSRERVAREWRFTFEQYGYSI